MDNHDQLEAPWVSTQRLESLVVKEEYAHLPDSRVTVCVVTRDGDYTFVGTAICAKADQYDEVTGRRHARRKALAEMMDHELFLLRLERNGVIMRVDKGQGNGH